MHDVTIWLVVFALTVVGVAGVSPRLRVPSPLGLTAVGIAASFVPWIPHPPLDPDLILVVLLPPLLYAAAIQVSLLDITRDRRGILMLAIGLVAATTGVVGVVGAWVLSVPLAAALALGAVVGPPDAVAATAIARRIGLPRRVVTLLEGESLVNDATAIVLLHTTTAAIVGTVTVGDLARSFTLSVVAGAVAGVVVAHVVGWVHARVDDGVTSTALSLITPWIAYLVAEEAHGSGVLAVVVTGLLLAHRSPTQQAPATRLAQRVNWATIQFFLENAVFLLAGLQLAGILGDLENSRVAPATIAAFCAAVFAATVLVRPAWMFLLTLWPGRDHDGALTPGELGVLSWAGMRGVVTLAAVLTLPAQTPHREVLVFAATVVVAGTLLLQGATLPLVARRLGVRGPDVRADVLAEARVVRSTTAAGLATLDRLQADPATAVPADVAAQLRLAAERRSTVAWEGLRPGEADGGTETPGAAHRRARLDMLRAERAELLHIRDGGDIDHEVLTSVMSVMDLEESTLAVATARFRRTSSAASVAVTPAAAPAAVTGDCTHLRAAWEHPDPEPDAATCQQCVADGTDPVHLRLCLTCGLVACCDSSPGRHASAHYAATSHPVVRSFEPDEVWCWCYVDEELG